MDQYVHLQPYPVIKSYPLTGLPEYLLKSQSINYVIWSMNINISQFTQIGAWTIPGELETEKRGKLN